MKVSEKSLERYDERLESIAEKAGDAAERMYDAMRSQNPNASVEEVREGLIVIIDSVLAAYGDMACEVTASEYDAMAEKSGAKLPPAQLPEINDETTEAIESRVRYVVRELVHNGEERYDI